MCLDLILSLKIMVVLLVVCASRMELCHIFTSASHLTGKTLVKVSNFLLWQTNFTSSFFFFFSFWGGGGVHEVLGYQKQWGN